MKERFKNLPLRKGVGIIILNKNNKVFVAKRIDNSKNFWQMPQGGVDEGEDFLTAAYRELKEETSISNVELIEEIEGITTYELPENLLGIIWKGKYKGQKQKWFLMRYLGTDEERKTYYMYMNEKLKEFCEKYNYFYFDIYKESCDEEGFIIKEYSVGYGHLRNTNTLKT